MKRTRIPRRSPNYARKHRVNEAIKQEKAKRKAEKTGGSMKRRRALRVKSDPLWLKIREQAFTRARGDCEDCGRPVPLNMGEGHHVLKRSLRPDLKYELSNVVWLCHNCHARRHGCRYL